MNRIKELRLEKGVSQKTLGEYLNLSQQAISAYEKGTNSPDLETLKRLSEFFNVSTDYILGNSNFREPAEKITSAIADEPELVHFWEETRKRKELKLLFKQIRELPPEHIKIIIKIIKAIEDEDAGPLKS